MSRTSFLAVMACCGLLIPDGRTGVHAQDAMNAQTRMIERAITNNLEQSLSQPLHPHRDESSEAPAGDDSAIKKDAQGLTRQRQVPPEPQQPPADHRPPLSP